MNKILLFSVASAALLLCSCKSEFNAVYKSNDISYRYEYAKENYALHKYTRASILFGDMINVTKGTDNGEECLFLYGMSTFNTGDYESAAEIFKKYSQTYPKGKYAEMAYYFVGESLYKGSPEPRLDQSDTYSAIKSFQDLLRAECTNFRTSSWRKSLTTQSSITTSAHTSVTAQAEAITTRLASLPLRMHSRTILTLLIARVSLHSS